MTPPLRNTRLFSLLAPLVLGAALTGGCLGPKKTVDPTVVIESAGGRELGVSTDYGVVFLGRGAQSGSVRLTIWYEDGPTEELGVVEAVGEGLYTTESPIEVPSVPISFQLPEKGDEVLVIGRSGGDSWRTEVDVAVKPDQDGILLELNSRLRKLTDRDIGAGVYVGGKRDRHLLGLYAGRTRVARGEGSKEYALVLGPDHLWMLVTHRRNKERKKPFLSREDIL